MKLGFITSILDTYSFEEVIDFASRTGYDCVEVACWPVGKAERRYAGVTHIDVDTLDDAKVEHIKSYCKEKGVSVVPGVAFNVEENTPSQCFRLNYSTPSDEKVVEGTKILGKALQEYLSR